MATLLPAVHPAWSLRYPWRPVRAPQAPALNDAALAWAADFGLVDSERLERKFRAVDVGTLTALTYPGAPRDVQERFAAFFGWVFLQDDFFDEDAQDPVRLSSMLSAFIAVLDGLEPPPDAAPPVRALADVRKELHALGGHWWFARFASSMRRYWLGGVLEEARHRAAQVTPSIPRYLDVRMESVCVYPVLDLVEAAYGFTLAPDVVDDPLVVETRRLATYAIALANDVFSYEKEMRAGDPHNLVHLVHVHEGRPLDEAFASVVVSHNDAVDRFDALAADLERRSPALRVYVEGQRRWMRGACDWQLGSRRYGPGPT